MYIQSQNTPSEVINWEVEYNVSTLPHNFISWELYPGSQKKIMKAENDLLHINTIRSTSDFILFYRNWNANNNNGFIIEAKVKLEQYIGSKNHGGCGIWFGDNLKEEVLLILPTGILLNTSKLFYNWQGDENTPNKYHIYRIEAKGNDLKIYIDGILKIDGTNQFYNVPMIDDINQNYVEPRNWIAFSDGSTLASAYSIWNYIKYTTK